MIFLILKIIGIILLILLLIILAVLAVILFVPIKYELTASKYDKVLAVAKASWLSPGSASYSPRKPITGPPLP